MEVVYRHDPAVAPLGAARVAEVAPAAVGAQDDFLTPRPPPVSTQPGPDAEGRRAVAVGQAKSAVPQSNQARRVPLAQIGGGHAGGLPTSGRVNGAVGFEP